MIKIQNKLVKNYQEVSVQLLKSCRKLKSYCETPRELLPHLESDGILWSSGDEVMRNPRRVVVLGDFDGKCIATGVCGAVTDQE